MCSPCTPGHYCITGSSPAACPAGFYCPEGTGHVWESCPAGTFSSETGLHNISQCTECTGGYYCDQQNATAPSGQCDQGYYCRYGSDTNTPVAGETSGNAGICPVGHYCAAMTTEPEPCPAGTFNNVTGIGAVSDCQSCMEGHGCETPSLEYPTDLCNPGYYCSGGSNSTRPDDTTSTGGVCPAGTYCVAGSTAPGQCLAGHYNPLPQQSACLDCNPGYYCEVGATTLIDCPRGRSMIQINISEQIPGTLYFKLEAIIIARLSKRYA